MKGITDIIRELREDKDLKQSDIADALNIAQQNYSRYETGRNEMSLDTLSAIADYHGVSADFILGRTACRQGIDVLNKKVLGDYTIGKLISDVLSLDVEGRRYIAEGIGLQKLKMREKIDEKGSKNDKGV